MKVLETAGLKGLYGMDFNRPQALLAVSSQQPEGRFAALLAQVKFDRLPLGCLRDYKTQP